MNVYKFVSIPISLSTTDTGNNPPKSSTPTVDSNAVGTTYFGGGFTRINENGGEIINLPTGTTIIPADKSEKLMNASPSVNVSVNIAGNIFGLENAADLIGDTVCKRIVERIKMV